MPDHSEQLAVNPAPIEDEQKVGEVEVATADVGGEPVALRLSADVWVRIMQHLSYASIRNVGAVCKKLQRITKYEELDFLLFRQKPAKKLPHSLKLEIHPLLEAAQCTHLSTKEAPIYATSGDGEHGFLELNAFDYPAVDEYSTQPACTTMEISVNVGKKVMVTDKNGIRNRRVLKALAKFWQQKSYGGQETWLERLGDHQFFEGWQSARVRENDQAVDLVARWFGS
ncbi:hypothetical protein JCM10213_007839 [Rhodosporidiobolus nylandii]